MPFFSGKCTSKARLDGKTAVVTGCNTGIGIETAKDLYMRGGHVIMACRDLTKANEARDVVLKATESAKDVGKLSVIRLDLNSFASIRQCAEQLIAENPAIHLLINNAGVMICPKGLTEDGFETQFGVNHLGHFLLTLLLLPRIIKSAPARIVTVSALAHIHGDINFDDINSEKSYKPISAYMQSKLANILFSKELSDRLAGTGVRTYSLHPGVINTELTRHVDHYVIPGSAWLMKYTVGWFLKTPLQGAQTTIYCAVDEETADETGLYYSDCQKKATSAKANDSALALRLWEESIKMTGLQNFDPFTKA